MDQTSLDNIISDVQKNKITEIGDDIIVRLQKLEIFHLVMEFSVMCGLINNPRFNAMIKRFEQKYPCEDKFKVVWAKFENNTFNKSFAEPFLLAIGKNNPEDESVRDFFKKANKILLLNNYGDVSNGYLSIQQCFGNINSKYHEEEDMIRKIYRMLK
jgi:hypothetical protein